MKNLNLRLQQYRKAHGFSQEELAQKLFISRQAVSKWEVGDSLPDIYNLNALAQIYGITLDELINGEGVVIVPIRKPDLKNAEELERERKEKTKAMIIWTIVYSSIYILCVLGVFFLVYDTNFNWLVFFMIPIGVPLGFAIRFFYDVTARYLLLFVAVPINCALLLFPLLQPIKASRKVWVIFACVVVYYIVASIVYRYAGKPDRRH